MNAVIIEDEALAADRLESMLREADPSIVIAARLTSVEESVRWLRNHTADLLFVDIRLSDGESFSIFDQVRITTPVIFTTAYDEYALKAFRLNSVDYLLKPIRPEALQESLAKLRSLASVYKPDLEELVRAMRSGGPLYKKRFLVQYAEKLRKVETEEIAYFFALEKSVFLHTREAKTYPVDQTLDKLSEMLDPDQFFRINRKMIIAFDAIASMVPWSRSRIKIELCPPEPRDVEALVSVERASEFKRWLDR